MDTTPKHDIHRGEMLKEKINRITRPSYFLGMHTTSKHEADMGEMLKEKVIRENQPLYMTKLNHRDFRQDFKSDHRNSSGCTQPPKLEA